MNLSEAFVTTFPTVVLTNTTAAATGEELVPYSVFTHTEAIGFATILAVFTVIGVIANFITFLVIAKDEKLRKNVFNNFLMSLCVSDFVSAINSPFVVYSLYWGYYEWNIPEAFCKIKLPLDLWTSAVTIQHILMFTILRFLSIQFPHVFRRVKLSYARIAIVVIWIETGIALFVPMVLWMGVDNEAASKGTWFACSILREWGMTTKRYVQYGFPILYYFPAAVIILFTLIVVCLILKRKFSKTPTTITKSQKEAQKEDLAILQLVLIIFSFLIGYVPEFAYRIYAISLRTGNRMAILRSQWLFSISSHFALRFSECLNPVFYNFGSSSLRHATKKFLRCRGALRRAPTQSSLTNSSQTKHTAMELT